MITIKFLLEYGTYPIWLSYDDGAENSILPPEWEKDEKLKSNLKELQKLYNSFFINDSFEFSYKGPNNEKEKAEFNSLLIGIRKYIQSNLPKNYNFVDLTLDEDN